MKRYRLLKDLPGIAKGTIIEGDERYYSVYLETDWFEEVKEIPEEQAWVVPGEKYCFDWWTVGCWFMPEHYDHFIKKWRGKDNGGNKECWEMCQRELWSKYIEPEKPKRLAPAYFSYRDGEAIKVSNAIFSSRVEALEMYGSYFVGWPALPDSEGYYPGPKGE